MKRKWRKKAAVHRQREQVHIVLGKAAWHRAAKTTLPTRLLLQGGDNWVRERYCPNTCGFLSVRNKDIVDEYYFNFLLIYNHILETMLLLHRRIPGGLEGMWPQTADSSSRNFHGRTERTERTTRYGIGHPIHVNGNWIWSKTGPKILKSSLSLSA